MVVLWCKPVRWVEILVTHGERIWGSNVTPNTCGEFKYIAAHLDERSWRFSRNPQVARSSPSRGLDGIIYSRDGQSLGEYAILYSSKLNVQCPDIKG